MFNIIQELFGESRVVIHVTRDSGESFLVQEQLKQADVRFVKEIEEMVSNSTQVNTGHVLPLIKLKVRESDVPKAKTVLKKD